ncbi:MAG: hypothetical protein KAJ43_09430, partial [Gemmatimonadetes bacterium]|nr:hypothetical protein [Gemmatimonadota bacterium]
QSGDGRPNQVSEAMAADLWRRATELQEEEARRVDERVRSTALQRALHGDAARTSQLSLEEVKSAAADAGIPAEYVELAWIESHHGVVPARAAESRSERAKRRFLGTDLRTMEVARIYQAPVGQVLSVMGHAFPNPPFGLILEASERVEVDGSRVLVFAVPGLEVLSGQSPVASFAMAMQWPDIKKLLVSVRALPGKTEATEVVIRSPLAYSRKLNYGIGLAVGSGAGFVAGGAAVTGGVALLSASIVAGSALAPLAVGAAGLAGFGAGRTVIEWAWRKLYGVALEKGRKGLDQLLSAITLHLQTDGTFTPGAAYLGSPPGGDDDRSMPEPGTSVDAPGSME